MTTYANKIGYSDISPFEVLRTIDKKTLEIRTMLVERDLTWKPVFDIGGFAGHCENQEDQKWIYQLDPSGYVRRIRLHKDGWWRDKDGNKFKLGEYPIRHYDYNF